MSFKLNVNTRPPESKLLELTEIEWETVYSNPSQPDLLVMRDSQDGFIVISYKVYAFDSYNALLDAFPDLHHVEPSTAKVTISIEY